MSSPRTGILSLIRFNSDSDFSVTLIVPIRLRFGFGIGSRDIVLGIRA